jgi:hypothetical protein
MAHPAEHRAASKVCGRIYRCAQGRRYTASGSRGDSTAWSPVVRRLCTEGFCDLTIVVVSSSPYSPLKVVQPRAFQPSRSNLFHSSTLACGSHHHSDHDRLYVVATGAKPRQHRSSFPWHKLPALVLTLGRLDYSPCGDSHFAANLAAPRSTLTVAPRLKIQRALLSHWRKRCP